MITQRNTYGYIGGSDANRLFGSYETATFRTWWKERITGIRMTSFSTLDTSVGNIMEARILDEVGVPKEYRSIFVKKECTIAGINTDALDAEYYHEVKTSLPSYVFDWLMGRKINISYVRQIGHGMYVTGRKEAKLHVLAMTKDEKKNPFLVDIKGRVKTFDFRIEDFDIEEYDRKIRYLTNCFQKKIWPSDDGLSKFI